MNHPLALLVFGYYQDVDTHFRDTCIFTFPEENMYSFSCYWSCIICTCLYIVGKFTELCFQLHQSIVVWISLRQHLYFNLNLTMFEPDPGPLYIKDYIVRLIRGRSGCYGCLVYHGIQSGFRLLLLSCISRYFDICLRPGFVSVWPVWLYGQFIFLTLSNSCLMSQYVRNIPIDLQVQGNQVQQTSTYAGHLAILDRFRDLHQVSDVPKY